MVGDALTRATIFTTISTVNRPVNMYSAIWRNWLRAPQPEQSTANHQLEYSDHFAHDLAIAGRKQLTPLIDGPREEFRFCALLALAFAHRVLQHLKGATMVRTKTQKERKATKKVQLSVSVRATDPGRDWCQKAAIRDDKEQDRPVEPVPFDHLLNSISCPRQIWTVKCLRIVA